MAVTDMYSPDHYVDSPPHELFDELRNSQPVYRQAMPDGTEYWAVLRYDDVVAVARDAETYSASLGGVVLEDLDESSLEAMRGMLLAMDQPRHGAHRKPLSPSFKARIIAEMEPRIREICASILDNVGDEPLDFVHDVTAKLPSQVMGELMGLPEGDWMKVHEMAERNTSGQDPDIVGDPDAENPSVSMAMYAMGLAAERRTIDPKPDLTSLILDTEIDGRFMSDVDFSFFFVQMVTAGNDTTKTMLAGGLAALLGHPDQMQALRDDRSKLPGAVEEILRWANPLHYFRRTATVDTELRGQAIAAGEKVAMIYTAANRDPEVFDRPHEFDITRSPNPHLSFGIGNHFCLGAHLARLEGRVFFDELFNRFENIELVGEPKRLRSNLNNSLKHLPVTLS